MVLKLTQFVMALLFVNSCNSYTQKGAVGTVDKPQTNDSAPAAQDPDSGPDNSDTFATIRDEIFKRNQCLNCHNTALHLGQIDLSTYESTMSQSPRIVVPFKPEESSLLSSVNGTGSKPMPMGGPPLSGDDCKRIEEWIQNGAVE